MKNPKGGRPLNYTHEQLLEILLQYTKEHPDKTVRLFELEEATGIKRHVWTYNMKDEIEKVNREIQKENYRDTGLLLPSAEQIVAESRGDEDKLLLQIQTVIDMAEDLSKYKDTAKAVKKMRRDYENKLEELECIIKEKDKYIEKLYEELHALTIDSGNPNLRKEQGIKSNIIEINAQNLNDFFDRRDKLLL